LGLVGWFSSTGVYNDSPYTSLLEVKIRIGDVLRERHHSTKLIVPPTFTLKQRDGFASAIATREIAAV
jgi:hypothetical protein